MLTAESGRTEQATGEVRPHCGKISKKRTSGVWHSGLNAILLRRTLSLHDPTFQRDQSRAILPPIRVGWAAYLGNVGLIVGNRTNQNGTDSWTLLPQEAKYIHIDIDPSISIDSFYFIS